MNGTGLPERKAMNGIGLPERKLAKSGATLDKRTSKKGVARASGEATSGGGVASNKANNGKTDSGKMADLYIVHGWTYTVEPWRSTLALLKDAGLNVKMLHVPGLTEKSNKVYTIADYVEWADREIPDGAVALGHSNGGRILLNLCSKKPEKLKYLVLMDSAGIYEPSMRKKMVGKIAKVGRPLKKIPVVNKAFHKITGTTDYSHAPENMKQTLVNMLESDKDLDFAKVKTRTLIIWGKKDTTTPPRQATAMYEKLPDAELKFYANWTHAPYIADPDGLAKALINIMTRLKKK